MNCLKAQTCITAYIDGTLSKDEVEDFLLHVKSCKNCREELEIYYTLIEATRQLDEGVLTTNDFMKELEDKINRELKEIHDERERRTRRKSFITLILLAFITFGIIKIMDIPIPILNPPKITWEKEREHIMEYLYPYIYQPMMK